MPGFEFFATKSISKRLRSENLAPKCQLGMLCMNSEQVIMVCETICAGTTSACSEVAGVMEFSKRDAHKLMQSLKSLKDDMANDSVWLRLHGCAVNFYIRRRSDSPLSLSTLWSRPSKWYCLAKKSETISNRSSQQSCLEWSYTRQSGSIMS